MPRFLGLGVFELRDAKVYTLCMIITQSVVNLFIRLTITWYYGMVGLDETPSKSAICEYRTMVERDPRGGYLVSSVYVNSMLALRPRSHCPSERRFST